MFKINIHSCEIGLRVETLLKNLCIFVKKYAGQKFLYWIFNTFMRYMLNLNFSTMYIHVNLTDSRDSLLLPTRLFTPVYIQSFLARERKVSEEGPRIIRELKHPRGSDAGRKSEREKNSRFGGNCGSAIYRPFFRPGSPRAGWMDNEKTFSLRTPRGLYITS